MPNSDEQYGWPCQQGCPITWTVFEKGVLESIYQQQPIQIAEQ
ncbi:hypothetical protein PYU99_13535 [Aeromonas media]|nr:MULTISPECIES: hypothetical protein [Aeromonas]WED80008.1 hypothetical protein PYU99_13535 [Aeromonas media]